MDIGTLHLDNTYSWIMFVYAMIRIIANIWVSSYMIYLFVYNIRDYFVDILKLLQVTFTFFWFFSDIITILMAIFWPDLLNDPIVTVLVIITDPYIFLYGLNQFAWLILIQHLTIYRQMAEGKAYSEWKKIVRKKELFLFITVMIILTSLVLIQIGLYTIKSLQVKDDRLIKMIINIEGLSVNIGFTIIEFLLYRKVSKTLENWLHTYFIENKRNIKFRMILNIWYFSIFSLLFVVNIATPSSVNLMVTFNIVPPYVGAFNIVYIRVIYNIENIIIRLTMDNS